VNNQAGHHLWASGCKAKNDVTTPKLPPPPRSSKQICIILLARFDLPTIGGDDLGGHEIVDGQTELA
jgi:hypothetical protein